MRRLIRHSKLWALPALMLLMSACASGVSRSPNAEATPLTFGVNQQAGQVSLSLTPEALKVAATTIRFDQEILLRQIRQGLAQKNALASTPDQALPSVEVVITSIRSRSAFNAVMWGFMAGDDHLNGTVIVRSPQGIEVQRFNVSASYALGGFAGGQTDARMGWLYDTFTNHVVQELTGAKQSTPPDADNNPPTKKSTSSDADSPTS
jgi:hypothetical protein